MKTNYDAPRFCQVNPTAQIGDDVGYGFLLFLRNFATPEDAIEVAAEEGGKIAPAGPLNDPERLWAVIVPSPALFDSGDDEQAQARAACQSRALRWPLMVANDRHRDPDEDDDEDDGDEPEAEAQAAEDLRRKENARGWTLEELSAVLLRRSLNRDEPTPIADTPELFKSARRTPTALAQRSLF